METEKTKFFTAHNIAWLGVLLSFVFVIQLFSAYLKIGTYSINLVLVPIVLGGIILGPLSGAILGFTSGVAALLAAVIGLDPATMVLLEAYPFLTVCVCIIKTTVAGLVSAYIYKWLKTKNRNVAIFATSASAPIINTGIFILGVLLMSDFFSAAAAAKGQTVIAYVILSLAGWNFIIELAVSLALAPSILRIAEIAEKRKY